MNATDITAFLLESPVELSAFLLSVMYVWLNARQNIWCWPVGGASVLLYAYVFFDSRLYADALLQLIYLGFSIYGWVNWKKIQTTPDTTPVVTLYKKPVVIGRYLIATAILFWGAYQVLTTVAGATLRQWDALTFALSLTATYWSARKIIENWPLWIITNLLYVGIYLYRGLELTAFLSVIMIVLSGYGWVKWRGELKKTQPA